MIFGALFTLSMFLTYVLKSAASTWGVVDVPVERSSHEAPTPRGGGVAIVATFYIALYVFGSALEEKLFWALWTALPVALVSLIDDFRPLSPSLRLVVQSVSATAALALLGGCSALSFGFFEISGIWINAIAVLIILWLTNLYNFLDGLDGYAAAQGIFVALGAFYLFGGVHLLWLAAAIGGFLVFNWHKASIFMGDVGSTTLGFIFAILLIADAGIPHFSGWLVLLSLFWFDATLTLFMRWKRGERLTQPHKKHLYQRFHQSGASHAKVVFVGMMLNLILLGVLHIVSFQYHLFCLFFAVLLLSFYSLWINKRKGFQ